jgi:hypothetical protein
MLRIMSGETVVPVEGRPGLRLVAARTSLLVRAGSLQGEVSYERPSRVERPGRPPIPIRDHLALARLLAVGFVLLAITWRFVR